MAVTAASCNRRDHLNRQLCTTTKRGTENKMRSWQYVATAIVICFLCAGLESLATALPLLRIDELVSQSDVVVVADVGKLTEIGPTTILFRGQALPGERYRADTVTLYTLSGSCPDRFGVEFEIPFSGVGYLYVKRGTRMLFLKKSGDIFVPTNPYYPDLPAMPSAPSELEGKEVAQQVIAELGAVVASPVPSADEKVEILGRSYAIPADSHGFTKNLLDGVRNTADSDVRSRMQAILLSRNEISQLPNVCDALLHGKLTTHEKELLLTGIRHKLTNPEAAPQLARLLQSSDPDVKGIAAEALWHTASTSSAPVLVKLLDDENRDVRCFAMRGLADASGQPQWGPGPAACEDDEAKYQQHWHEWAAQNQSPQPVPTTN